MIAKPEWFGPRKYGGWGAFPKTRAAWIYIILVMLPFVAFHAMPFWSVPLRTGVTVAWLLFVFVDMMDVMVRMKLDEREKLHEAFAERNASRVMMLVLVGGILYQGITSGLAQAYQVDVFLIIALILGAMTKAMTYVRLEGKT